MTDHIATPEAVLAAQHERRDAARADMERGPVRRAAHRVLDCTKFDTLDENIVKAALAALLVDPSNLFLRDVLIKQHMTMAWKIASAHRRKLSAASKLGQGPDDLYGSAMLGLVQGVTWVAEGRLHDDGITGYLYVTIRRFVMDYCEADHLVPIDRRSLKGYYDSNDGSGMTVDIKDTHTVGCRVDWGLNYEETLAQLMKQDPEVIGGLVNGSSQVEIAAELGIAKSTVCKRLAKVHHVEH